MGYLNMENRINVVPIIRSALTLFVISMVFCNFSYSKDLVSIDTNKAIMIAMSTLIDKKPDIKIEEYVFSRITYVHAAKDNEKIIVVVLEKDDGRKGPLFRSKGVAVTLSPSGEFIKLSEEKRSSTINNREVIDYRLYDKKCLEGKKFISSRIDGDELCKYGKNKCNTSIDKEAKYTAYCLESKLSECFDSRSWLTGKGMMELDEDVDVKNITVTSKEICGYVRKNI